MYGAAAAIAPHSSLVRPSKTRLRYFGLQMLAP